MRARWVLLAMLFAAGAQARVFIFRNAIRNVDEFRAYAQAAARLKRFGEVQVDLGVLADKSWYDMPPGRSPWHEFGSYNAAAMKFFPHAKLAPHLPAEWVAANRRLLLDKAAILREHHLLAAFSSNDTHFLPEAFFRQHPQLRGPRVDHPRRSLHDEFSMCIDQPEAQAIVEWQIAELVRNVPEIRTVFSHHNDSGAGLCWARDQYSGPNGPAFCKRVSTGPRLRTLLETMQRGAAKSGGRIAIRLSGTFTESEEQEFLPLLPKDTYLSPPCPRRDPPEGDRDIVWTGSLIPETYPVVGLIDPVAVIAALEKNTGTVVVTTSLPWYHRGNEPVETVQKLVDVIEAWQGGRAGALRRLAARWGGERNADALVSAFGRLHHAIRAKERAVPGFDQWFESFGPASSRFLTRPLLIKPELLGREDEAYFLPFVFNIYESEARNDYQDYYGSRMQGPPTHDYAPLEQALEEALVVASTFESVRGAPEGAWLQQLGLSLRMWVSEVRSMNNFYFAQEIRNRNAAALAGPPRMFPRTRQTGDPDSFVWQALQREEFDNTVEFLGLLRRGGVQYVARAQDARHEDTFLLGPELTGAVQKKADLMRAHWLDADGYLVPGYRP